MLFTPIIRSLWDVAFGPCASDKINVTGNAAVNGTADVTIIWLQNNKPVTLISTGGTAIDNGLKVTDTLALDFRIVTAPNAINLAFTAPDDQRDRYSGLASDASPSKVWPASGLPDLIIISGSARSRRT